MSPGLASYLLAAIKDLLRTTGADETWTVGGIVFDWGDVQMWELDHKESWVLKNWCFQTTLLEKTLESPLDCKESKLVNPKGNQSWIFLEGLMLKLKLRYFGHVMRRTDSLEKTLMLGGGGGRRRRGRQRMRDGWMASLTWWTWVWASSGSWWRIGKPGVLQTMGLQRVRHDWAAELTWGEGLVVEEDPARVENKFTSLEESGIKGAGKGLSSWKKVVGCQILPRRKRTGKRSLCLVICGLL